jgi:hypothetical protein
VDAVFYPNAFDVDITRFLVYYQVELDPTICQMITFQHAEDFTVNFLYKGVDREIHCTLRVSTYTYQFLCAIDNTEMILERDDEGNFRAMEADPFSVKKKKPDPALVRMLIEEMERILNP